MADYAVLTQHLENRLSLIADEEMRTNQPKLQLQKLGEVSGEIDQWRDLYREELPAKLLHFLDNYSLDKALAFLKELKIERCGK